RTRVDGRYRGCRNRPSRAPGTGPGPRPRDEPCRHRCGRHPLVRRVPRSGYPGCQGRGCPLRHLRVRDSAGRITGEFVRCLRQPVVPGRRQGGRPRPWLRCPFRDGCGVPGARMGPAGPAGGRVRRGGPGGQAFRAQRRVRRRVEQRVRNRVKLWVRNRIAGNFRRKRADFAGLLYSSATSAVGTSAAGSMGKEAKAMKKTATRWAAIAGGARGAVLLVGPGASADRLPLHVEHSPVVLVPADSSTAQLGELTPSDGGSYTVFGRWDDELI